MGLTNFDDIRPYYDSEIPAAAQRVADNPHFTAIVNYLFPDKNANEYIKEFRAISTTNEFQIQIMHHVIRSIVDKSSSGLTASGFDKLNDENKCMFIANHRDILLDSAILQILLWENALSTSEITFGSNLMTSQFVIDIGKMNKMFKISREGTIRDFYRKAKHVSNYMRYAITEKSQSVWIAQRNGRAKKGDDKTEMAVLKMFALSSKKLFIPNLLELNITPLVISYEYEPCDFLKVAELYVTKYQKYVKEPNEDLNSIIRGVTQWKGHIDFVVCDAITKEELEECDALFRNEKFQCLADIIDQRIYSNYKLWKTNYMAYDMLNKCGTYSKHYTEQEKAEFKQYMDKGLGKIEGEYEELRILFLEMYANPIKSKEL